MHVQFLVFAFFASTGKASQWVRVDFLALNADERLIFMARFMLHFEVSGLVVPIVTVDTYQVRDFSSQNHTHPDFKSILACLCFVCVHALVGQVNYYDTSNALDLLRIFAEACVVVLWIYNLAMQVSLQRRCK